jgi:ferritin-like protein
MNVSEFHEPAESLSDEVKDYHRALVSLGEEIEAIDWYNQRHHACTDPTLAAVLAHNRDEEIEHAAMALEWLRRQSPVWDRQLRTYLFTEGPITEVEAAANAPTTSDEANGLGIGRPKWGAQ